MKKLKEILLIFSLFCLIWIASAISYSGFHGSDGSGYIYFSRDLEKGLKECFQNHRILHISILSIFPEKEIIRIYGFIFSLILIIAFYLVAKKLLNKEMQKFCIILLLTSPIFIVMSPTVYTEIPSLSLIILSLYSYIKRNFYFSGILLGISVFFKEIALFMLGAMVIDIILNKRDHKIFIALILGFLTVFAPLFFAYFIFTEKIWFIDFFLRSNAIYSQKFSFVYDFILRKIAFLFLLGISFVFVLNFKKLKLAIAKVPAVLKYYFIISLICYFLFHAVSPRFSIFFLPIFFVIPLLIERKHTKFLFPLLFVQVVITIYTIHIFTQPFIAEKRALEFIVNNFSQSKVYGFSLSFWYELKNKGFEIAHNISSANIVFVPVEKVNTKEFKVVKTVKIPCTLKFFRMLGCKEKEYAIALRKI